MFPTDYASSYVTVRSCRASGDHDLNHVRVLADPLAAEAYMRRDRPFPTDAVVLKEEYEFSDDTCTGPVKQWTAMVQLAAGTSPSTLDWHWQKVNGGNVVSDNEPRCYGCHATCGVPPDGYRGTCAVP
ncbi:MAG TPA: cytochrome P460 family protein [Kofleriaceae bacterium]